MNTLHKFAVLTLSAVLTVCLLVQKQILGIESQSGSRLEAANVSKDGGISNKDLVILQKHILGISQIDQ